MRSRQRRVDILFQSEDRNKRCIFVFKSMRFVVSRDTLFFIIKLDCKSNNMYSIKLLISIVLILFIQCNNNGIDKKLFAFFNDLEKRYDTKFLKEFKETPEQNVLDMYLPYFFYEYQEVTKKNIGMNIDSFFQSFNLKEEPSRAYVFLILWHRKLNNKESNIDELMTAVNDSIKGVRTCENLKNINAVLNFRKLNIKDNIQLKFSVRVSDGYSGIRSTVYYGCPTLKWNFDTSKDLIISGEVIKKDFKYYYTKHHNIERKNSIPQEFYIELKIKDINREGVLYFFKEIQKNDTIEVNLNLYGEKI